MKEMVKHKPKKVARKARSFKMNYIPHIKATPAADATSEIMEVRTAVAVVGSSAAGEDDKPSRVAPRLKAPPSIRQLYWCDFPKDAQLPEFWKTRPVLIVSFKNTLAGATTVIPCSSQNQDGNEWAVRLKTTINGERSWAICDKPTTVAVSRLSPDKRGVARLPVAEFNPILSLMLNWLPKLP